MKKRLLATLLTLMLVATCCIAPAAADDDTTTLDLFVNHTWWPLPDWSGSIPEYITQQCGVNLNVTVAADMQQLPLMLASGELPDLIYCDNTGNMQTRLASSDFCWDWETLMDEYVPGYTFDTDRSKLYRQADGKFYTILNNYSTPAELQKYSCALIGATTPTVQQKLYEELGSPVIQTTDDLINLLIAAKNAYPDLIPAVINTNWIGAGQTSSMFLDAFGCVYNGFGYDEATDKVMYYIEQNGRLEYYKFINRLYREGLIIPENFAFNNEDESYDYAYNLKCFAYIKGANAEELNQKCATMGVDSDWVDLQTNLNYGTTFKKYDRNVGWSGLYVSKNCKDPEAAAKLIAYLFSEEGMLTSFWGIEGTTWHWSEDGTYPVFIDDYYNNDWLKANGLTNWGLLSGTWAVERLSKYDPENANAADLLRLSNEIKTVTVSCPAVGLVSPEADSDEQNVLTKLNTMVTNEETKIYLAESEEACEAAYNNMLDMANQIGMADLDTWANATYQSAKEIMQ